MSHECGLKPASVLVRVAAAVRATAGYAVFLGVRGRDNTRVVSTKVEAAAVPGGQRHMAVDTGNLRLVAVHDMIGVAIGGVVEGPLLVAVVASETRLVQPAVNPVTNGAGDASRARLLDIDFLEGSNQLPSGSKTSILIRAGFVAA